MNCANCGEEKHAHFNYCPYCGTRFESVDVVPTYRCLLLGSDITEKEAIQNYFHSGFKYDAILCFLEKYHAIKMSLSTLKRRLNEYNLRRRNREDIDMDYLAGIVRSELDGPGCLSGYRSMWHTLRIKHGIVVPRLAVEYLLRQLDANGVQERRRHKLKRREYRSPGPSYCWHVDGYDKLKPYGFPVHAAIDGYSRRVMWLVVTRTNNDPAVTAKFYFDCVHEIGGCPRLLVSDCGTENGEMASIQCFLRADGADDLAGEKAHRYVPSPRNQRIESWWSYLRRSRTTWWINFFRDMQDKGELITGSELHENCLWFCFAKLLQEDLNFVKHHWNTHNIRASRHDGVPGVPDELFFIPEQSNSVDHLQPVSVEKLDEVRERCKEYSESNDFLEYFQYIVQLQSMPSPKNWREGKLLYEYLLTVAQQ